MDNQEQVVAIYDKKTGHFSSPAICRHVGEAVRDWDTLRKNPETKFGKNPEDFDLVHIATFDYKKGQYNNLPSISTLSSGV